MNTIYENNEGEKNNNTKLLKISSEEFINNLEKRGFIFDNEIKKKLYKLEKKHKKDKIPRKDLFSEFEINNEIINLINLFNILDDYNINYINYILIFNSLCEQKLKNFYRYIMIKWNKVKNNLKDIYNEDNYFTKINDFSFRDRSVEILNEDNLCNLKNIIIGKLKDFIYINNNIFPNIFIIFLINTLQEYLYPI